MPKMHTRYCSRFSTTPTPWLKFGHSEKDTKFEKNFNLKFDVTQ